MNIARKALVGAFVLCCVMTCSDASTPFFSVTDKSCSRASTLERGRESPGKSYLVSYSVFNLWSV
jgi:hypothetical protein